MKLEHAMTSRPAPCSVERRARARGRALLLGALVLSLAAPAAAAPPRIAIARVKGDASGGVARQLVSALCTAQRCVPGLGDGSRARLARIRKRGVEAAVLAALRRTGDRREVAVTLVSSGGRTLQTWRLPLGQNRRIPSYRLGAFAEDVQFILRPGSRSPSRSLPPPAPLPRRPDPPAPAAEQAEREPLFADDAPGRASPEARPALEPRVEELSLTDVVTVSRGRPEASTSERPWESPPQQSEPAWDGGGERPPTLVVDAMVETARHALSFPSGKTVPVGYVVNLYAVPRLRLEGPALAGLVEELTPLRAFADVAYIPAVNVPSDARTMRVAYLRVRAGALWPLRLERGLVLRPALTLEVERMSIRVDGGARFPSLPDTALAGPSLGLDLELPLGATDFTLLAGSRAIWWLQAGELAGGAGYFPGGRAVGLEAEVGARMRIGRMFAAGVHVDHATTLWWLDPDPRGRYTVSSARASTWGGRVWVRLQL